MLFSPLLQPVMAGTLPLYVLYKQVAQRTGTQVQNERLDEHNSIILENQS